MPTQPSLFGDAPTFDRPGFAARIRRLAERKIFVGTSSWRYEGWLGQVYAPERYLTRGKFSKKSFTENAFRNMPRPSRSSVPTSRSTPFPRRPLAEDVLRITIPIEMGFEGARKISRRSGFRSKPGTVPGPEGKTRHFLLPRRLRVLFWNRFNRISTASASFSSSLAHFLKTATPSREHSSTISADSCADFRVAFVMGLKCATTTSSMPAISTY